MGFFGFFCFFSETLKNPNCLESKTFHALDPLHSDTGNMNIWIHLLVCMCGIMNLRQ